MSEIKAGDEVVITDAEGDEHAAEALSGIVLGKNFPFVWIARPLTAGGTDRCPWPLEAVRLP